MEWGRLRKPSSESRLSSRPLMASVGPLLVPGRSSNAVRRWHCLTVRPGLRISMSAAGTRLLTASITAA